MMNEKKVKKIELDKKERQYLSGLVEAHRIKIDFLSEGQKEKEQIREDLRIANRVEKKLAFN
jgi:plasmid maintenance system killer protein